MIELPRGGGHRGDENSCRAILFSLDVSGEIGGASCGKAAGGQTGRSARTSEMAEPHPLRNLSRRTALVSRGAATLWKFPHCSWHTRLKLPAAFIAREERERKAKGLAAGQQEAPALRSEGKRRWFG